jgi:hypothetical protein
LKFIDPTALPSIVMSATAIEVAEVIWPLALKVTGTPTFCQVRSPPTIGLLLRR